MATTFFDLPLELRNMVYHELWESTPVIEIANEGLHYSMDAYHTNGYYDTRPQPMPLWLMTNKQILQEAVDEFQLDARWRIVFDEMGHFTSESTILSPLYARRLEIVLWSLLDLTGTEVLLSSTHTTPPVGSRLRLNDLVIQVAAHQTIKELTIEIHACDDDEGYGGIDMSNLAVDVLVSGVLNKFIFLIKLYYTDHLEPVHIKSYEAEVAKVGEAFFGGPARITTEELCSGMQVRFIAERC